jgi:hypothetical protein
LCLFAREHSADGVGNRMIPLKLRFTGLELDPMDLLQSRQLRDSPIPEEWTRIRFEIDFEKEKDVLKIEDWVGRNTDGKWSIYSFSTGSQSKSRYNRTVVVAFELDVDAIMFRLKSGEVAWNEEQTEF